MSGFRRVGRLDEFPEGRGRAVDVDGRNAAVFKVGGRVLAIQDACPHMGASLADGKLVAGRVTCHWHGWTFDLESGRCTETRRFCARTYEVRVEGDEIWLKPPPAPSSPGSDDDDWVAFDPDKHLKRDG